MNGDLQTNLERSQHSAAVIGCFHHLLEHPVYGLEYIVVNIKLVTIKLVRSNSKSILT